MPIVYFLVANVAVEWATEGHKRPTWHGPYLWIAELSLSHWVSVEAGDLDSLASAAAKAKVFIALGAAAGETWLICRYARLTIRAS